MKNLFLGLSFLFSHLLLAQTMDSIQQMDEIVITGTKYPIAQKYSGKILAKITQEELKQFPHKSLPQLLNEMAGFEINGTRSAAGKNVASYVQGGKAGQIMVIVDGIPVIDPSGIDMSYDLNMLSTHQIESVEIIRGAAGTLYGSGAATAVINIRTLDQNSAQKFGVEIGTTFSSQRSVNDDELSGSQWNQKINLYGKIDKINYLISYNGLKTDGLSEAYSYTEKFKDNPFEKQHVLTKLNYRINTALEIGLNASFSHSFHLFDQNAFTDSEQNKADQKEYSVALQSKWNHKFGNFQWNIAFKNGDRFYKQFNDWTYLMEDYQYKTSSVQSDLFHLFKWSSKVDLMTGLNFQQHQTNNTTPYGNIDDKVGKYNSIDPYFNFNFKDLYGFNLSIGSRYNLHSEYGNHATFNFNPSYLIDFKKNQSLKFLASWSSAYLVPSIFQLHSNYGNINLKPETTQTIEFGWNFILGKKIDFNTVYFNRTESNSIVFVTDPVTWNSRYENDVNGHIYVSGVETGFNFTPAPKLNVKVNYTYTNTSKERPFSIPKHKWNARAQYTFVKNTLFSINYQYTSDRTQMDFSQYPSVKQTLEKFNLVNIALSKSFKQDKFSLHFAVDNLFDENYVETIGYTTLGRNYAVSFNYKL